MDKDCAVIILGISRWDYMLGSTSLSFAKELARTQRVFYIDRPYSIKDYLNERKLDSLQFRKDALLRGKNIYKTLEIDGSQFTAVTPQITLPINSLPEGLIYRWLAGYNNRIVCKAIKATIRDFRLKKYIYINSFLPTICPKIPPSLPQPLLNIYQTVDDISQEVYISKHGIKAEITAVQQSDFTLTTSSELCRKLEKYGKNVHLIRNAADTGLFSRILTEKTEPPEEIKNSRGKVIIFTGALNHLRMDYDLLIKIALHRPEDTLLVVGPYDQADYEKYQFARYPNIRFTGKKPIALLPNYLKFSSCGIIPFLKNQLTKSIYPLKINEYLATGLPVVTTDFSEDISSFRDVVYLAKSAEAFLAGVDKAISENNETKIQERVEVSKLNTWQNRIQEFMQLVDQYTQKN